MVTATHITIQLVRFEELFDLAVIERTPSDGALWSEVAADSRAAGTPPGSSSAFAFAAVELFADEASARASFATGPDVEPWTSDAAEVWKGVLQPFRHGGSRAVAFAVNWLDRHNPGPLFACGAAPPNDEPIASLTTVGWDVGPDLDMSRVVDFSNGTSLIRDSMAGIDGLHSQHSFGVPCAEFGMVDFFTLSFWRDARAMRAFAHGPGTHKEQVDRFNLLRTADRATFTQLRVLDRTGSWWGSDPVACW
jgi:hypothetical protein